jgi:hypothetical protein
MPGTAILSGLQLAGAAPVQVRGVLGQSVARFGHIYEWR